MSNSMFYTAFSDAGNGYAIQFTGLMFGEKVKDRHIAFFSDANHAEKFVDAMNSKLDSPCAEDCLCGRDFKEVFQ